jgi:dihydrolipoamide dehydrogenase
MFHKVQSVERNDDLVTIKAENAKGEITLEGDYALLSEENLTTFKQIKLSKKLPDRGMAVKRSFTNQCSSIFMQLAM